MTKDHRGFGIPPSIKFRLLNKKEMAALLGVTTKTIERMAAAEKIPHVRAPVAVGKGTRLRFDSREIEKWILGHSRKAVDFKETLRRLLNGDA